MGKRSRQHRYSEEFRREALRLLERGDRPVTQLAAELGVSTESLRLWRQQAAAATSAVHSPTRATVASLDEENRQLRQENARLLEEREILKKATAFFARERR